jgi:hypothetical protein
MGMLDESWCSICGCSIEYGKELCVEHEGAYPEEAPRPDYNWVRYTFVCDPDECDALLEFTARDGYGFPNGVVSMTCPCGREMIYIKVEDLPKAV